MAAEQINFPVEGQESFSSYSLLGVAGMIGAPALLMEMLLQVQDRRMIGLFSLIYVMGWISSSIGMRRLRATGNDIWSTIVFGVQMLGLLLALLWSLQEIVQIDAGRLSGFFAVADAAWPLSHLFMLVVAGFVIKAGVWRGWRRVAPLLCGLALPTFFSMWFLASKTTGGIICGMMTTAGFGLLGYAVSTGHASRHQN